MGVSRRGLEAAIFVLKNFQKAVIQLPTGAGIRKWLALITFEIGLRSKKKSLITRLNQHESQETNNAWAAVL